MDVSNATQTNDDQLYICRDIYIADVFWVSSLSRSHILFKMENSLYNSHTITRILSIFIRLIVYETSKLATTPILNVAAWWNSWLTSIQECGPNNSAAGCQYDAHVDRCVDASRYPYLASNSLDELENHNYYYSIYWDFYVYVSVKLCNRTLDVYTYTNVQHLSNDFRMY